MAIELEVVEEFKIENFNKAHPALAFPWHRSLSAKETESLRQRLALASSVPVSEDLLLFTQQIASKGTDCGADAAIDDFDLGKLFERVGVAAEPTVFVSWYRFDEIDEIRLEDLAHHFDDIWYPSADDIEIFDATCGWMVSVRHDGQISFANFAHAHS